MKVTLLDGIPNDRPCKMTKLGPLDKRFDESASRHARTAIEIGNSLINQLILEFKRFNVGSFCLVKGFFDYTGSSA